MSRCPHLLPAAVALATFAAALIGFDLYARAIEADRILDIAPLHFNQKLVGRAFEAEAFRRDDLLPIYGSSELRLQIGYVLPFHASTLFASRPTGFDIFPIGKGGTSPLNHLQKLASVGAGLWGKKLVVSISPLWFFDSRTSDADDVYAGNFSALHAYELAYSTSISPAVRRAAAVRMLEYPNTLSKEPLLEFALRNLTTGGYSHLVSYYTSFPLGRLRAAVLRLQDHWESLQFIWRLKPDSTRPQTPKPAHLDWNVLAERGERHYKIWCANNPFGIDGNRWEERYKEEAANRKNTRSDRSFRHDMDAATGWWTDLDLLLHGLSDMGAKPLLISAPILGPYYEHCGVPLSARLEYYRRIRQMAAKYRLPEVDFADHDQDLYFALDTEAHLSPKGWVYYAAAFDAFEHGRPIADHTIAIAPLASGTSLADNDTPEIEGSLDAVDGGDLEGWVWDALRPDVPVSIEIDDGQRRLGLIAADGDRPDLAQIGKGNGKHGFSFPIPAALHDGNAHTIRVCVPGGSGQAIDLNNSPRTIVLAPLSAEEISQVRHDDAGSLDQIDNEWMKGWAWNPMQPDVSVGIEIDDGDKAIATGTAEQDRPDLAEVGKGNGRHGFAIHTPAALLDGKRHAVTVRLLQSGFALNGSPMAFQSN
jgi:D-alanine transfer protein